MRFGAVVAGGLAALVAGAVTYGYISDRGREATPTISPPSGAAFSDEQALADGPSRGLFSPDGRRVAVLDDTAVAQAEGGKLRPITPPAGRVVDFAWMPDSASVLVAEGPIPTGQVSVVDLAGKVKGTARLDPSIGFGSGYGMSVDSRGARAAVIAVERDAIGGRERTDLAVIDLTTGAVSVLATPELNERQPVFVDDETIVFLEGDESNAERVMLVDIASQKRVPLPGTRNPVALLGVTDDGRVVVGVPRGDAAAVVAVETDGSARADLVVLEPGQRPVAVDPQARRLLVASDVEIRTPTGGAGTVSRLRAVDVK